MVRFITEMKYAAGCAVKTLHFAIANSKYGSVRPSVVPGWGASDQTSASDSLTHSRHSFD